MKKQFNLKVLLILSLGHLVVDLRALRGEGPLGTALLVAT